MAKKNRLMAEACEVWAYDDGTGESHSFIPTEVNKFFLAAPNKKEIVDFDLKNSMFGERRKHSDSRSFYNSTKVLLRGFQSDWRQMLMPKHIGDDGEREQVRSIIWKHYRSLTNCLLYWGSVCEENNQLNKAAYVQMFEAMGCMHKSSSRTASGRTNKKSQEVAPPQWKGALHPKLSLQDLDINFKMANAEAANLTAEIAALNAMNSSRLLCRYEFILAFFLAGRMLYWKEAQDEMRHSTNVALYGEKRAHRIAYSETISGSIEMFFEHYFLPFVEKTEALCLKTRDLDLDPEKFRREHLYRPGVDYFLHRKVKELRSVFDLYALPQPGGQNLIDMDIWFKMLGDAGMFEAFGKRSRKGGGGGACMDEDDDDELTEAVAIYIFASSQMFEVSCCLPAFQSSSSCLWAQHRHYCAVTMYEPNSH